MNNSQSRWHEDADNIEKIIDTLLEPLIEELIEFAGFRRGYIRKYHWGVEPAISLWWQDRRGIVKHIHILVTNNKDQYRLTITVNALKEDLKRFLQKSIFVRIPDITLDLERMFHDETIRALKQSLRDAYRQAKKLKQSDLTHVTAISCDR